MNVKCCIKPRPSRALWVGIATFAISQVMGIGKLDTRSVTGWTLLGPFESRFLYGTEEGEPSRNGYRTDFLESVGGESKASFQAGDTIKAPDGSVHTAFAPEKVFDWGWVDVPQFNRKLGYGYAEVDIPKPGTYYVFVMSHGSPQLWVNGKRVIAEWRDLHKGKRGQHSAKLELLRGTARLLIKIDNGRGWAGFHVGLLHGEQLEAYMNDQLKSFTFEEVHREGNGQVSFIPEVFPVVKGFAHPVLLEMETDLGKDPMLFEATTGERIQLPLPPSNQHTLRITARSRKFDGAKRGMHSRVLMIPVGQETAPERVEQLKRDFDSVRPQLEEETPRFSPALDWIEFALNHPLNPEFPNVTDIPDFAYIREVIERAKQGENFFQMLPHAHYPCLFLAEREDGSIMKGEYELEIPGEFLLREDPHTLPVRYYLHSHYEVGRHAHFRKPRDRAIPAVDPERWSKAALVSPLTGRNPVWDPDYLEAFHQHLMQNWGFAESRIHVDGYEIGGTGLLQWSLQYPHRFACLAPMVVLQPEPFLTHASLKALSDSFKDTPIWMAVTEKHQGKDAIEKLVDHLKAQGVDIRFDIYQAKTFLQLRRKLGEDGFFDWMKANSTKMDAP